MTGKIHSFQSLGTLDGPGVRFLIFLHGCNLHCGYCHNIDVCRGEFQEYEAADVVDKILRYREYFGENGGVTVSGGEPLLQAEFVLELFALLKQHGIHTALDTSGSVFNETVRQVLTLCDLVLLDIKMTENELYEKHIGCSVEAPLRFLDTLEENNIPCYIRHVVVGGLNDTEESIKKLKQLTAHKACVQKIELLPFRKICEQKYKSLGIPFPFAKYEEPDQEKMHALNEILQ